MQIKSAELASRANNAVCVSPHRSCQHIEDLEDGRTIYDASAFNSTHCEIETNDNQHFVNSKSKKGKGQLSSLQTTFKLAAKIGRH